MKYGIDTRCQHLADDNKDEIYGAISYPIYQSATFARDRVGGGSGYDYSRLQNPTREHLEKIVASLEEGIDALAFSTGMAAITALMEIFKPGDHIIIDEDLYGGSVRLFHSINVKNGLTFTSVDLSSVDVEDYIQDNTKAIYAETPTNPMMRVSDLEELAKKAKKHDLLLIVDNTFLSPYFQNPLKLGADIVVHSGTKYLGGHNDTLAGFLITNREDIQEQLRFIIKTTGATLAPMDSWLILRGIKTLGVRMERAQENALKYFEKYNKQKRTFEALTSLIEETRDDISYLESVSNALDIALSEDDLTQIKEELIESGYIRRKFTKKKVKITSKPFHYLSSDGYHIYVGKNNLQNEELTFHFASGNDWWFHAKGIPGSHVIVKTNGEELPDRTFEEAGKLAAYYSKNRGSEKIEIDYIEKKHVKKPKGGKPGFVVYYTNYSLMIDSDISQIKQLED